MSEQTPPPIASAGIIPSLFVGLWASTTQALIPLRDWDHWWHLAMARIAQASGHIPDKVYFLYTMDPQAPSYVQPWLAQRIFLWMQLGQLDSPALALAARDLLMGVSFMMASVAAWRRSGSATIGAGLALWGATLTSAFFGVRTFMLPWPLFGACLATAYAARAGALRGWVPALIMPAAAALWANLHGSFVLPALIALAACGASLGDRWLVPERYDPRAASRWAAITLLCALAPAANPLGLGIYGYMALMAKSPALNEFAGDWFPMTPLYPDTVGAAFYLTLTSGVALLIASWRRERRRAEPLDMLLLVGFGLLAIRQCRELMWFGLVAPLTIAPALRGLVAQTQWRRGGRPIAYVAAAASAALMLILQPWTPAWRDVMAATKLEEPPHTRGPHYGLVPAAAPREAVDYLRARYADKLATLRIFCAHNQAGYLLYHLQAPAAPSPMVFTDNRYELPDLAIWDSYHHVADALPDWRDVLARYGVHAVIVGPAELPALFEALMADPAWRHIKLGEAHTHLFISVERMP